MVTNRILNDAFVELLEWDDYFALPETLAMDAKRIMALRDAVERMAVSTGVILLVKKTTSCHASFHDELAFHRFVAINGPWVKSFLRPA